MMHLIPSLISWLILVSKSLRAEFCLLRNVINTKFFSKKLFHLLVFRSDCVHISGLVSWKGHVAGHETKGFFKVEIATFKFQLWEMLQFNDVSVFSSFEWLRDVNLEEDFEVDDDMNLSEDPLQALEEENVQSDTILVDQTMV